MYVHVYSNLYIQNNVSHHIYGTSHNYNNNVIFYTISLEQLVTVQDCQAI